MARRKIELRSGEDFAGLSYYTLCKLSDATHFSNPQAAGVRGTLTVDGFGNFISFASFTSPSAAACTCEACQSGEGH